MAPMTWFKHHVFPNIYRDPVDAYGEPRDWTALLLENIDYDIKRDAEWAELFVVVRNPDTQERKIISLKYQPSIDADTIRSMIKASA